MKKLFAVLLLAVFSCAFVAIPAKAAETGASVTTVAKAKKHAKHHKKTHHKKKHGIA